MTTNSQIPQRYIELAFAVGGEIVAGQSGAYCRVESRVNEFDRLGRDDLSNYLDIHTFPLSAFTLDETRGQVAVHELICLDTETTGLGGTGTVPFLIGCGRVTENGFTVCQYLLPDYADETAVLEDLLKDLSPDATLVTYNGAAFDIPLVRDRLVLNRVGRDVPFRKHLDLLHPARRLFKRRLKDCSLVNVERELFGHVRTKDIPGYLIPSVYFEWLNEQTTDNLKLVLEHNRQDIVTLIYLCHRIAGAFVSEGRSLSATDDIHSLSRVYGRRRHLGSATALYNRMERESDQELAADILLYHSYLLKRSGDWERAVRIWTKLSESETKEGYRAAVELAKYYEHRVSDYSSAQAFARRALQICPYSIRHRGGLQARLERLSRLSGR